MLESRRRRGSLTDFLLLPYAIPVIAVIYYLDTYEREPRSILLAALLWGGSSRRPSRCTRTRR